MTYQETLDFLYKKLPMYQRVGKIAYKKDLTNTVALLKAVGNPHKNFKTVHIAGTNGKGTSAHGIAAILQQAGYKTGLYTSPHLKSFTERIKINGEEIDQELVVAFIDRIKPHIEEIKPSFFEITVAMAFHHFSNEAVDIAVIETGLGGRLDSTNVIMPEVCLITNIGMDHTDMLGDTLEKIAEEKAGIIKSGIPVVIGNYQEEVIDIFKQKAETVGAELILPSLKEQNKEDDLPYYKRENKTGIVLMALELKKKGFQLKNDHITSGLDEMEQLTHFKGRYQLIQQSPKVIADVSHNKEGLKILFEQVMNSLEGDLYLIFGTVKDKDLQPIFQLFPKNAKVLWTQSSVPRSLPITELHEKAENYGLTGVPIANVDSAIEKALSTASKKDLILVTGSTFVVAEISNL